MKTNDYQKLGWKRSVANWIHRNICCKLWGHANGKRMTEEEIHYFTQGKEQGYRQGIHAGSSDRIFKMGAEIHRLCRLVEKRNRKIRSMRLALRECYHPTQEKGGAE